MVVLVSRYVEFFPVLVGAVIIAVGVVKDVFDHIFAVIDLIGFIVLSYAINGQGIGDRGCSSLHILLVFVVSLVYSPKYR